MTRHVLLAAFLLTFLPPLVLYAADESPCDKCRNDSQKELMKCLEGAISEEDKKTCAEKNDQRVQACSKLECKLGTGK